MSLAPAGRGWLSSRRGALPQIILIIIGAIALPGGWWLSPVLLAGLAAGLLWLAGDDWPAAGFGRPGRPAFWWITTAVAAGGLWQYAAVGVLAPLASRVLQSPPAASPAPAGALGLVVSVAVFGLFHPLAKGLAYRGFLLNRLERLFGTGVPAVALSFGLASIVFGLGNWYQGPAAVVVGALTAAVFNALYYWARRNVWPSVLAHAVYNGVALSLLVWIAFNQRLDGRTNATRSDDVDYGATTTTDHQNIGLTWDEKLTLARWVDLGAPINLGTPWGWFEDDLGPTLWVRPSVLQASLAPVNAVSVGAYDLESGLKPNSLHVTLSVSAGGHPAGYNFAAGLIPANGGVLNVPLPGAVDLAALGATLTVSISDNVGQVTTVVRHFSPSLLPFLHLFLPLIFR
jgi:membrane protease YdiL (CAAX protease family)